MKRKILSLLLSAVMAAGTVFCTAEAQEDEKELTEVTLNEVAHFMRLSMRRSSWATSRRKELILRLSPDLELTKL